MTTRFNARHGLSIGSPAIDIIDDEGRVQNVTIDSFNNEVGADHIHYKIKANEAIAKGNLLKYAGYNTGENAVEVVKISAATDVAIGISHDTLAQGEFGLAVVQGITEGFDTSAFTAGTVLYPNTTGGLTATAPTSGTYQACAFVLRSQTVNGALLVSFISPDYVTSSANTANTAVLRDGSGNFSAGTISAALTGNATTATTLQTARTINGVSFDGSANIVVPTNLGVTAGTTAGPIITSSSGTSATIPSASTTASGIVTTGTQTFAGAKTFTNTTLLGTTLIGTIVADNSQSGIGNGFGASINQNEFYAMQHTFFNTDSENGGKSSELMRLTESGDLGIGVSNPSHKLSVAGTGNFTGTVTAPTFTGSVTTRTSTTASTTSLTPNTASFDMIAFTALASALTINAPTGSPTDGTKLLFRILDNGTARALTWNGTYTPIGVTLPTTTVVSKTVYVGCIYNANNTRWDVIAVTTQA